MHGESGTWSKHVSLALGSSNNCHDPFILFFYRKRSFIRRKIPLCHGSHPTAIKQSLPLAHAYQRKEEEQIYLVIEFSNR